MPDPYVPRVWSKGEVFTASGLNRLEQGVADAVQSVVEGPVNSVNGKRGDVLLGFKDLLRTDWVGQENASASRLYSGDDLVRTNEFPNPEPVGVTGWFTGGAGDQLDNSEGFGRLISVSDRAADSTLLVSTALSGTAGVVKSARVDIINQATVERTLKLIISAFSSVDGTGTPVNSDSISFVFAPSESKSMDTSFQLPDGTLSYKLRIVTVDGFATGDTILFRHVVSETRETAGEYFNGNSFKYITKSDVGLDEVDNTSDLDKPVSSATQTALDEKISKSTLSGNNQALIRNGSGALTGLPFSTALSPQTLPVRGANGEIKVGSPTDSSDATTKAYVDAKSVKTGTGLTGGGDLSAERTIALDTATQQSLASIADKAASIRKISAGAGLKGGGDLTADRTIALSDANVTLLSQLQDFFNSGGAGAHAALQDIAYQAYGHSFGVAQANNNTTTAGVYPNRVAELLKVDSANYFNRCVSGQRAAGMLSTIKSNWYQGSYGLVTMMITQNDAGYRTGTTNFKNSLRDAIDWVRGVGEFPPTVVLILDTYSTQAGYNRYPSPLTDAIVDSYNDAVKSLAAEYPADGSVVLANANDGWDRNLMTAADGQHPNDRGSAHIAQAVLTALSNQPFREGQNLGITKPSYFYDSFNRAGRSSDLGVPLYYATNPYTIYTALSGVTYGIVSNRAYRSDAGSTGESVAVVDTGSGAIDLSLTISSLGTKGIGPVWRCASADNLWVLDVVSTGAGNAKVYKKVSGTFTQVGSALSVEVTGLSRVRITHTTSGSTPGAIRVYVDGVLAFSATDNTHSANTKHGIRFNENSSGTGRLDDLVIKNL